MDIGNGVEAAKDVYLHWLLIGFGWVKLTRQISECKVT